MGIVKILLLLVSAIYFTGCSTEDGRNPVSNDLLDLNADGIKDIWYEFVEDGYYELIDRNFDKRADESHFYGLDDKIKSSKIDDDYDGLLETKLMYLHGTVVKSLVDIDFDGLVDIVFIFQDGNLKVSKKYYPQTNKIGEVYFDFGYPSQAEKLIEADMTHTEFSAMYSK